ncbi:hypothetical protein [Niveispirillum sp. SYP-B3756]|nr:hypothetical protein [Niveispirillum sp. SYP-B3756]
MSAPIITIITIIIIGATGGAAGWITGRALGVDGGRGTLQTKG